jgi:hypothetical protein
VIRRFVEKQDVRGGEKDRREQNPHLPAPRELAAATSRVSGAKTEPREHLSRERIERVSVERFEASLSLFVSTEEIGDTVAAFGNPAREAFELPFRPGDARPFAKQPEQRDVLEFDEILGKISDTMPSGDGYGSLVRFRRSGENPEKRGLSRSVGADETDPGAIGNVDRKTVEEKAFSETKRYIMYAYHALSIL